MPSLMATWAPDDVEDPFWLCRVDSPPAEGTAQVTWLELADGGPRADGSTHYELGGQQPIEENTFIGPVEGSVGEDGNFVLTKAARDEIDAAIAEATPSSTNSAAPPAAAAAPTQQPIVVAADKPLEFLDEKFAFATCTVEVDQEKAGSKLPFPPKPGFKLTSPRQFHQYVGEHIKDLPGAVQCDEMLDESTELFKASRALIEEIAAEYERWRRHFAEVDSVLGVGWKVRMQWNEPYRALTGQLDGPVCGTILVRKGGYGPVSLGDEEGKKSKAAAEKAAKASNAAAELVNLEVRMAQNQGAYAVAHAKLKGSCTRIRNLAKGPGNKYCWELEPHSSTGLPVISALTDKSWSGYKKLIKKVQKPGSISIIAVGDTPVTDMDSLEAALKAVKTKETVITVLQNEPLPGAKQKGSVKKFQLKASSKAKVGFGWVLKDNADGAAAIVKMVKDGAKDGPARSNDVPVNGMIRAVQGKKVHGVKDVERELKKHAGKKVLFEIEKKREKAKTYTSVKHMDAMAITKLIYGVDTTVPPIYGHIPGIRIGDQFFGRNPTSCVGLHRPHMTGICFPTWMNKNVGKKDNVASMGIVMSGGYEDDEELEDGQSNSEDQFWYTGDGGNDVLASCSQTSDQKDERGNRALIRSSETGLPVRVNRGVVGPSGKTITYNGLYKVEKFTFAEGKSGHKVYRFHMVRLNKGQSKLVNKDTILHKMVGNQSDKYARWKRDYFVNDFIDPKTGKRKDRKEFSNPTKRPRIKNPHLICEDISNGQERRPIPVFNEVDSEQLPPDFEYTAKSLLIGDATSFKAQHEYPSIESIKQVDECPCVQLTAKDGNIANGSRGEGYHAGAGLWGARDVIYECYGCAHSTLGGLLQNRVVQTGILHHLEVFKTKKAGWGLRAWNEIPAGAFICTYEGEIMTSDRAEARAQEPDRTDRYYYDLKIQNLGNRPENNLAAGGDEETEEDDSEEEEEEEQQTQAAATAGAEVEQEPQEAASVSGRPSRRAASKKRVSYNEDDYYNQVGGDMLTATGRKGRKAAEAWERKQDSKAKRRKTTTKKKKKPATKKAAAAAASASASSSAAESDTGPDAEYVVDGERRGNGYFVICNDLN